MASKGGSIPKHGVAKKQRAIWTTDESWKTLDDIARQYMLSKSELLEMIGQGRLRIVRAD
jgi:hypothetical protein